MASSLLTKTLIMLVIIIVILQIIHMLMLYQLETLKIKKYAKIKAQQLIDLKNFDEDRIEIDQKIKNSHVIDSSGQYRIINNLLNYIDTIDKNYSEDFVEFHNQKNSNDLLDLTIVTQCSVSRLYYIEDLLNYYEGPISLSVFTLSKDIPSLTTTLLLMRKCLPSFRKYVKIHLIYPLNQNSFLINLNLLNFDIQKTPCSSLSELLKSFKKNGFEFKHYGEGNNIPYPVNLLRNTARKNVNTKYILVSDIDLIPSTFLRNDFIDFISKKSFIKLKNELTINLREEKIAYIIPTYELDTDKTSIIPNNKTKLIELISQKIVRPFYFSLCNKCQKYTNYEDWQLAETTIDDKMKILFEVFWKDPWEPFYIAKNDDSLPFYDERFKQYGFNRISQVCETHVSGFRFVVINKHFLIHKGWKKQENFHEQKDLELERNRLLFRQFKNELKDKYIESNKRCY